MALSEESKIAVLENEVKNLTKSVDILGNKFDILVDKIDNNYVKVAEFSIIKKQVDNMRYWQAKAMGAAAVVALVVNLVLIYFGH